jgi:hypothetical protein
MLDAALAKNLRRCKKYCPKGQKAPPGWFKGPKYPTIGVVLTNPYLSDYFGTPFAKFRLSCNSLKNLF